MLSSESFGLCSTREAQDGDPERSKALAALNVVLAREGWEAFYDEHGVGQIRHIATNTIAQTANPHRPMTPAELERRDQLTAYLDKCSEDELIEEVLLPLFRQLGFYRITAAGHKDKALEYGKDVWMKYTLPTLHVLYFGIQAKKEQVGLGGSRKGRFRQRCRDTQSGEHDARARDIRPRAKSACAG